MDNKEKQSIQYENYIKKIGALNTSYYDEEIRELESEVYRDNPSQEEIEERKNSVAAKKRQRDKLASIIEEFKSINMRSDLMTRDDVVEDLMREYISDLTFQKKQATDGIMQSEDLKNAFAKQVSKNKKSREKEHYKELKKIVKEHKDLNKKISSNYRIDILDPKYQEYDNKETLNLVKLGFKDDDLIEEIYKDNLHRYTEVGSLGVRMRNNDVVDMDYSNDLVNTLGIDMERLENRYNEVLNYQYSPERNNYGEEQIKNKLDVHPMMISSIGKDAINQLDKLHYLQARQNEVPDPVNDAVLDDVIELYNRTVEIAADIQIMDDVLYAFRNTNVPAKMQLANMKQEYQEKYQEIYAKANAIYEKLDVEKRLDDKRTQEVERIKQNIIDESVHRDRMEHQQEYMEYKEEEQRQEEARKRAEEKRKNRITKEEDLIKQSQILGPIRTAKYNDYTMYKMGNNDNITFIDYLTKENVDNNLDNLITYEQAKNTVIEKLHKGYHDQLNGRQEDLNSFIDYCGESMLIEKLGGLNTVVKQSDLEDYLDHRNMSITDNDELSNMLNEQEESYESSNGMRM